MKSICHVRRHLKKKLKTKSFENVEILFKIILELKISF